MPIYNKLVRDRIPEIIAHTGKKFSINTLNIDDYHKELKKIDEYMNASNDVDAIEELADLLEIKHTVLQLKK